MHRRCSAAPGLLSKFGEHRRLAAAGRAEEQPQRQAVVSQEIQASQSLGVDRALRKRLAPG
jgi:hypothetical protein